MPPPRPEAPAVESVRALPRSAISEPQEGQMIEYMDGLHEHFVDPDRVTGGRDAAPRQHGASTEMQAPSPAEYGLRPQ